MGPLPVYPATPPRQLNANFPLTTGNLTRRGLEVVGWQDIGMYLEGGKELEEFIVSTRRCLWQLNRRRNDKSCFFSYSSIFLKCNESEESNAEKNPKAALNLGTLGSRKSTIF